MLLFQLNRVIGWKNIPVFITQKRKKAKDISEKDFYKLLNNAFYGKTMENVRNRIKLEFIRKDDTNNFLKTTT